MPSRADSISPLRNPTVRRVIEHVLHIVAAFALVIALIIALRSLREEPNASAVGTTALRESLVRWSTGEAPANAHVVLDSVPNASTREWLSALRGVGTATTWEGNNLTPTGVTVEPVVDPKHPARIWIAAPKGTSISLRDGAGALDTLHTGSSGAVLVAPSLVGAVHTKAGNAEAVAAIRDSVVVRPVLVLGTASWEGKFTAASLEEYGWSVDARFVLAPKQIVVQGPAAPVIDTAHYAAVVALDSTAARYAGQIASFVRQGGGLITIGEASNTPALRAILPASATGSFVDPRAFESDTVPPRTMLALNPLVQLADKAAPVERRGQQVTIAIHRVGMGRVLQVGYMNSWRWRMAAAQDNTLDVYRRWWSGLVSSVAYAPRFNRTSIDSNVDPAPRAALTAALGNSSAGPNIVSSTLLNPRMFPLLFGLIVGSLLLEWASRRLRGAP